MAISRSEAKILVADDSKVMRRMIVNHLVNFGFNGDNIQQSPNAMDALTLAESRGFHLLITNLWMPLVNGLDFVKTVRENGGNGLSGIPIIMISAEKREEYIQCAIDLKVNAYIIKPFEERQLKQALDKIFPA